MHALGFYAGTQRNREGDLVISFEVEDNRANIEQIGNLPDQQLVIDVKKFFDKRSDKANRYCWKLCGLMADTLGVDKDTIYMMKIKEYGQSEQWEIPADAIEKWKTLFRVCEPMYSYYSTLTDAEGIEKEIKMVGLMCYRGSHTYNTKEMSIFINGLVQDAKDIGIETWTPDEIAAALAIWRPRTEMEG